MYFGYCDKMGEIGIESRQGGLIIESYTRNRNYYNIICKNYVPILFNHSIIIST